jgi:hypothetical protein
VGLRADEKLSVDDMIAEKYRGIRPAPGYPACPEHGVKLDMFRAMQADEIGMALTESLAMTPAASVSGFYLAHPDVVAARWMDGWLMQLHKRQEPALSGLLSLDASIARDQVQRGR